MNKIYVVGLGPGAGDQMTVQAKKFLTHVRSLSDIRYILILSVLYFRKAVLEHSDAKRSRPL